MYIRPIFAKKYINHNVLFMVFFHAIHVGDRESAPSSTQFDVNIRLSSSNKKDRYKCGKRAVNCVSRERIIE